MQLCGVYLLDTDGYRVSWRDGRVGMADALCFVTLTAERHHDHILPS